ncbi:MAG: ABC transporter permease [Lachnospiraceae bacterium]|nr:ABC transporter permease [Lachnospiraceae bacterium]
MRISELLRLAWMNINQNKFKAVMTSVGIVVGAATIVLVIGIGQGGQKEVAEQFANLNAGAINVSYEYGGEEVGEGFSIGGTGTFFGNIFGSGAGTDGMPGGMQMSDDMERGRKQMSGNEGVSGAGEMPDDMQKPDSEEGVSGAGEMPDGMQKSDSEEGVSGAGEMPDGMQKSDSEEGVSGVGEMPDGMQKPDSEEGVSGAGEMPDGMQKPDSEEGVSGVGEMSDGEAEGSGSGSDMQKKGADNSSEKETEAESDNENEESMVEDRLNQEEILLNESDVETIETYVDGITAVTLSYSTKAVVEGGNLTSEQTYTVAGVKDSFLEAGGLELAEGDFLTSQADSSQKRVCVLGASSAEEIFGSTSEALGGTIYIADRKYTVIGILRSSQTVTADISPDTAILVPYETGIKYITGSGVDPVITVIARDVNVLEDVIEDVGSVLKETYPNASFHFEDSGSKMEAARSSNRTLTMLLSAMAAIVFFVGGIGIMNVLFVSVKERTNEIGILKAIGTPRSNILFEFLTESAAISFIGGMIGVGSGFALLPVMNWLDIRVETGVAPCITALGFAVLTGTVFGIYPAWKASRLEPVDALNAD